MFIIDSLALKRLGKIVSNTIVLYLHMLLFSVDPVADVRVRALKEISSILKNNIPFNGTRESAEEISVVDLHILVTQLIKWFQFRPVWHEAEVLDLLVLILTVCRTILAHDFSAKSLIFFCSFSVEIS